MFNARLRLGFDIGTPLAGAALGIFGGGNSKTTNINETYNTDNRVGVDGGQGGAATATQGSSVVVNSIDPGLIELAGITANHAIDASAGTAAGAINLADQMARLNADIAEEASRRAIQAAENANAALAAGFGQSLEEVRKVSESAISTSRWLAQDTIAASKDHLHESLDFASSLASENYDLAGMTIDAVLQNTKEQTQATVSTVRQFASDLYTANQTESERTFDRIAKLATVGLIVLTAGFVLTRARA